jgi:cytochrome c biogenesis protein CcdA
MPLLMLFALIAGAGTALSPCVLPVLPAVLSAGVTGPARDGAPGLRGPRPPTPGC